MRQNVAQQYTLGNQGNVCSRKLKTVSIIAVDSVLTIDDRHTLLADVEGLKMRSGFQTLTTACMIALISVIST
jgi:hypothetical protein